MKLDFHLALDHRKDSSEKGQVVSKPVRVTGCGGSAENPLKRTPALVTSW